MADSTLGGSHLVNVWYAESERAQLPAGWDSPLPGFAPEIPSSAVWGAEVADVQAFYQSWPPAYRQRKPFAMVADFDGDGGASRLVVPEVRLDTGEHGFVFKWMLSPEAMQAVEARRKSARGHDGG